MEAPTSCSTSRMEAFPAGLRVLVVDDDPTWLKILEKMLRKCSYEVTTCGLARAALDMLRERRDRFDIVISDVNMPDMDGFKLLEHVGLEMDLPVIMMSVDGETSRVMKGVQHGACDYLLKPVRMKELRNIWQHVFRKKIHEIKEVESHDSSEEFQFLKCRFDEFEERQMLYGGDVNSTKKRKDMENREHFEPDFVDPASVKKARVVWTVDLHQKFVNAVNHIGFDKVGPKKILDLMRVPGLTRENVASHLQKYRLYLSRLQKQNEGITFGGPFPSNHGSEDATGNFSLQSPVAVSRNGPPTDGSGFSPKGNHAASVKAEVIGDDQGSAMLRTGSPRSPTTSQKEKSATQSGGMIPQKDVTLGAGYHAHSASIPSQHSWNGGIAAIPFTEYRRYDHVSSKLLKDYQQLQHTGKKSNGGEDYLFSTSANPVASSRRQDESGTFHIKRAYVDFRSNMQACSAPLQVHQRALDCKILGVIPEDDRSSDVEGQQHVDQDLFDRLDSPHQKNNLKDGSVLSSSPEDLLCSLEEYGCFDSIDVNNNTMEILNCSNSDQINEIQGDLYDDLQLDCEYIFELMKYPTTSGGDLFT